MSAIPIAQHIREHRSVLARAEKELLVRIARKLPPYITPDMLTALGLCSMAVAGVGFWLAHWHVGALSLVVVGLATNWFGDSLDGTVARVRNCQRPRYGFYVDHILDVLGFVLLMGGLALSGFMTPLVALSVTVAYLMVCAEIFLATAVAGVFRLAHLGVGPTELRILLIVGTAFLLHSPVVRLGKWGPFLLFDIGGIAGCVGLLFAFFQSAARNTRSLYRAETVRW